MSKNNLSLRFYDRQNANSDKFVDIELILENIDQNVDEGRNLRIGTTLDMNTVDGIYHQLGELLGYIEKKK